MINRSVYVAVPLLIFLTILQAAVLPFLRVGGVLPQLAVLAPIGWGLRRGPAEGMVWAFIAGVLLDLFSYSPIGAGALALMAAILVVSQVQAVLPESPYLLPIVLAGLAYLLYTIFNLLILRVVGYQFPLNSLTLLPTAVVLHGLLGLPAYWLAYSLDRMLYPRQIEA